MDHIDILNAIFDVEKWKHITQLEKKKHGFLTMRQLSIAFPIEACKFSTLGTPYPEVLDFFHSFLSKKYNGVPPWVYTKSKSKKEKSNIKIDKEIVNEWASLFQMSTADTDFIVKHNYPEIVAEMKRINTAETVRKQGK